MEDIYTVVLTHGYTFACARALTMPKLLRSVGVDGVCWL